MSKEKSEKLVDAIEEFLQEHEVMNYEDFDNIRDTINGEK